MFNHTKDIPFAAAMMGATFFLICIARSLPLPRTSDLATFGLLAGAALGIRVLGLLLIIYAGVAILLYIPRPQLDLGRARWPFATHSSVRLLPALLLAYVLMILAWPWAALASLNPIRGLLEFSEFQYRIRTVLGGQIYDMANVPRLYVPIYILVRMPLLTLFCATLAILFAMFSRNAHIARQQHRRDVVLVILTVILRWPVRRLRMDQRSPDCDISSPSFHRWRSLPGLASIQRWPSWPSAAARSPAAALPSWSHVSSGTE